MKRPESIYLTVSTRFVESSKRAPSAAFIWTVASVPLLCIAGLIGLIITGDLRVTW